MYNDVVVIGGGVIGLAIARELALHNVQVVVLDRGNPRDATSWAAAGMLAPQSETDAPSPFFDLCLASARMYRAWADRVHEESDVDPEYADSGLICLASDEDQFSRLRRAMEWQSAAGLKSEVLKPEDVVRLEPELTLPLAGAVLMPEECHVTPRSLLDALKASCIAKGVRIETGVHALEILSSGVRTSTGRVDARSIVVASGVHSAELDGVDPPIPLAPRKGQILSLAAPKTLFRHMVRWEHSYMVQRRNGDLIVGATSEDAGFDRSITPAGIGGLLDRAQRMSSGLGGLPIREMWTGLRPAAPDGLPIIGKSRIENLIYATGHYRNGILLAPITAACVAALVEQRQAPVVLDAFSPARFAV